MKSPLHILHLEDDPNDAALVQSTLEAGGITCATTRVQNHDDFVAALEHGGIDLILSDFTLPAFDGLSAVEIVRTRWPAKCASCWTMETRGLGNRDAISPGEKPPEHPGGLLKNNLDSLSKRNNIIL